MRKIKRDPRDELFYMGYEPPLNVKEAKAKLNKILNSKEWIEQCNRCAQDSCLSDLRELMGRHGLNRVKQCLDDLIK